MLAVLLAAAITSQPGPGEPWRVQLTPYVWAAGLEGRIRPAAGFPDVRIERSFGELLEDSDGAAFLTGTARKGRGVILGDLTWTSSSSEGRVDVGAPVALPASGGTEQVSATLAGGWTVARDERAYLDIYAGARLWRVRAEASVPALGLSQSVRRSWADPVVGARFHATLSERWSAIIQADGGGGAMLGGADATYQFVATVNWQAGERVWLSGGWRHLSVDYRRDGVVADLALNGPLAGATWRF